jgi:DNA-binding HxlR family transcriptional regulator
VSNIIQHWDKAFENKARLAIMSILIVTDWADFNRFKEQLDLTDGNLASHLSALEKVTYIEVRKSFIGKKPNTSYRVTALGKKAFKQHLQSLEKFLRNQG